MEIRTNRLLIRPVRLGDGEALVSSGQDEPVSDQWYMLTIANTADSQIYGDLALLLTCDGRSAEIGFTLATSQWGKGYAAEAVDALVGRLFADGRVTKISATTHPENFASAMVLEHNGFVFEGRTALSDWSGDENTDDLHYGLTRSGYQDWIGRNRTSPESVELVEVASDNWWELIQCATHKSEERFVSPIMKSLVVATYDPVEYGETLVPWTRAIEADGEVVGLVMMAEASEPHPDPYLWRLIVDRRHQRRGIGGRVVQMAIDRTRSQGYPSLRVSWVDGKGSPRPMYERIGFVPTGEIKEGETLARLML